VNAPTLSASDTAALAALAASPLAAEAAARIEAARTARRRELIEAMQRTEAAALAEARTRGAAAAAQRAEVTKARAALDAAAAKLHQLEGDASIADDLAARVRLRAGHELAALGNAAIDETLRKLAIAETQARTRIGYRILRDANGREVGATETDARAKPRRERMRTLAAALEGLRFDPAVTPAEIERKCSAAAAEADAPT
jgi:hypothetical protein